MSNTRIESNVLSVLQMFGGTDAIGTTRRINHDTYILTQEGWAHEMKESKPATLSDLLGFSSQEPNKSLEIGKIGRKEIARLIFALRNSDWLDLKTGVAHPPPTIHVFNKGIRLCFTGSPVTSTLLGSLGETTYRLSDVDLCQFVASHPGYRVQGGSLAK